MDDLFKEFLGVDINFTHVIQGYALLLARITPAIFQTPFMGGNIIQGSTKIGISMVLVLFFYPVIIPNMPPLPESYATFILLLVKEFFVGFILGFLSMLPFQYVTSAGSNMDMARGASMGMMQNPGVSEQVTFLANLMYWFLVFLLLSTGGHHLYIEGLVHSFSTIPPTVLPSFGVGMTPFVETIIRLTADCFIVMVQLGAPVLIVMLLIDVIFGLFNRIAQQMQVGEMSMTLKLLLGLWVFFLSIPVMVRVLFRLLAEMLQNVNQVIQLL